MLKKMFEMSDERKTQNHAQDRGKKEGSEQSL